MNQYSFHMVHISTLRNVQDEALDVVFQLVADADGRVREAAGKTLAIILPRLYFQVDWQGL